jgi:hypothetical protein
MVFAYIDSPRLAVNLNFVQSIKETTMKNQWKLGIALLSGVLSVLSVGAANAATAERSTVLSREAGERPRGGDNERPGDRRGGRFMIDTPTSVGMLARETSEGPRGGDNERPGDRQRGRKG